MTPMGMMTKTMMRIPIRVRREATSRLGVDVLALPEEVLVPGGGVIHLPIRDKRSPGN
jgi:hypothetical protein